MWFLLVRLRQEITQCFSWRSTLEVNIPVCAHRYVSQMRKMYVRQKKNAVKGSMLVG